MTMTTKQQVSQQPTNSGLYELQKLSSLSIKICFHLHTSPHYKKIQYFSPKYIYIYIEEGKKKKKPFLYSCLTIQNTLKIQNLIIQNKNLQKKKPSNHQKMNERSGKFWLDVIRDGQLELFFFFLCFGVLSFYSKS